MDMTQKTLNNIFHQYWNTSKNYLYKYSEFSPFYSNYSKNPAKCIYGPNKIQLVAQFVMKMHQNAALTQNKALNNTKLVAIT